MTNRHPHHHPPQFPQIDPTTSRPNSPGPTHPATPANPGGVAHTATLPRHDPSDPHRDRWPEAIHC
ncbi:MAG: hypothetical protein NC484_08395, partial [Alloprevotella sp.]|nr:hypothetical protein [Alloprevotella sp.]